MVGPKVQNDLSDILLKFRCHEYVLTAYISMMYRQIRVAEEDQVLQRIYWRDNASDEISTYQLTTVTYGTASAPYLATRCLKQLATEEGDHYPVAKQALFNDFYVDDVLIGSRTLNEAKELQLQLMVLLNNGCFKLRKWRSNNRQTLNNLSQEDPLMVLDKQEPIKTLGILWNSSTDELVYRVSLEDNRIVTKRTMLTKITKLFDPLGMLGPIVVKAKIIMQLLWTSKADWDEEVSDDLRHV